MFAAFALQRALGGHWIRDAESTGVEGDCLARLGSRRQLGGCRRKAVEVHMH
jgi:hypothetical protein